jgi:endonuclease/exonuclease/phosphatase (EEP) superfamily protein YafD
MREFVIFLELIALLYAASSIVPLLKTETWWIRVWDFPRAQLLFIGLIAGTGVALLAEDRGWFLWGSLALCVLAVGLDLYRILPYTPLWRTDSLAADGNGSSASISLLTGNVFQFNEKVEPLLSLVREKDPDLLFLVEVDQRWARDLAVLEETYEYVLKQPQDNTYGLLFFSRYPLEAASVKNLVEDTVPSIQAQVRLPNGMNIQLFGLHPEPPKREAGDTTERDAELLLVAETAKDATLPTIVMGDLNDVAWSHTTRLFKRISRLQDPRVGRGPFSTFPVNYSLLRFPLDYVFHSRDFRLRAIERLGDIGSDHFPMFCEFELRPEGVNGREVAQADGDDLKEARGAIQRSVSP